MSVSASTRSSGGGRDNPHLLILPQLLSAKKKIGKIAMSFNPEKDTLKIKGFESGSLTPAEFKEQLRQNFDLVFTSSELGAVVSLCDRDGNGKVNSSDFLAEFFRLGKMAREKIWHEKKREEVEINERNARRAEAKVKKMVERLEVHTVDDWTEENTNSAIKKLAKIAFYYDTTTSIKVLGFKNGGFMRINLFKDQLLQNFKFSLNIKDFSALCSKLRKSDTPVDAIDCNEFLYLFSKLGLEQREKYHQKQLKKAYEIQQSKRKFDEEISKKSTNLLMAKMSIASDQDRDKALEKIRAVAQVYNPDTNVGFRAFEARYLSPTAFREQLKQNLKIFLTPAELKAMVELNDAEGRGMVDSFAFLSLFHRIGEEERVRLASMRHMEMLRKLERRAKRRAKVEAEGSKRTSTSIIWPVLPNDNDNDNDSEDEDDENYNNKQQQMTKSMTHSRVGSSGGGTTRDKRTTKPTMHDLMHPDKISTNKKSMVHMFPKASEDTKTFLREIEQQEKIIRRLGRRKRRKPRRETRSEGKDDGPEDREDGRLLSAGDYGEDGQRLDSAGYSDGGGEEDEGGISPDKYSNGEFCSSPGGYSGTGDEEGYDTNQSPGGEGEDAFPNDSREGFAESPLDCFASVSASGRSAGEYGTDGFDTGGDAGTGGENGAEDFEDDSCDSKKSADEGEGTDKDNGGDYGEDFESNSNNQIEPSERFRGNGNHITRNAHSFRQQQQQEEQEETGYAEEFEGEDHGFSAPEDEGSGAYGSDSCDD